LDFCNRLATSSWQKQQLTDKLSPPVSAVRSRAIGTFWKRPDNAQAENVAKTEKMADLPLHRVVESA
jgi:hypothetical protein